MKAGVAFLALIVMANVVAAGVITVLAGIVKNAAPWSTDETWPWAIISVLGIASAIAFLRGAFDLLATAGGFKGKTLWHR